MSNRGLTEVKHQICFILYSESVSSHWFGFKCFQELAREIIRNQRAYVAEQILIIRVTWNAIKVCLVWTLKWDEYRVI